MLLLLCVTAIWGSTFAVVKTLGDLLAPAVLIFWRFLIAVLALLPVFLINYAREKAKRSQQIQLNHSANLKPTSLWRDSLILGAWLIAGYGTQTIALTNTTANRAAFFTALSVVLVPLWLTFIQKRKMLLGLWLALPLAVGGLALLSWEGGQLVVGDAWALACAVTYAGFILTLERLAHRHAPLPFTLTQLLGVTFFALLWVMLSSGFTLPPVAALGPLLYLGVVATALTTLMQTIGQRSVIAAEASLIYALEPVTASLFSFFLIHEKIGQRGALGGLFVVIATILSQRAIAEPHPKTPTPQPE